MTWPALTELRRLEDLAERGLILEQQRALLLDALSETVLAWRLSHYGQQVAAGRDMVKHLRARLARVLALVESIQRALDATGAAPVMQGRAAL